MALDSAWQRMSWLYYQYLLVTALYMLEPWERTVFSILAGGGSVAGAGAEASPRPRGPPVGLQPALPPEGVPGGLVRGGSGGCCLGGASPPCRPQGHCEDGGGSSCCC